MIDGYDTIRCDTYPFATQLGDFPRGFGNIPFATYLGILARINTQMSIQDFRTTLSGQGDRRD